MIPALRTVCLCLIAVALVACGSDRNTSSNSVFNHISVNNDNVTVHAKQAPAAIILRDGSVSIDGEGLIITAEQQQLLADYYRQAVQVRDDGIGIGTAGGAMAGHAIGAVVSGLASGNPDQIGPRVEAQAEKIKSRVADLCLDLQALRSTQEALVAELPAFGPYATISKDEVERCKP